VKTIVFKANFSDEDKNEVLALQREYSFAFRRMFMNMELMQDPDFLASLPIKSKKQVEYLQKEVMAFYERVESGREKVKDAIATLEQIANPNLKQFRRLHRLNKSLDKSVVFGDKTELVRLSKGVGDKENWIASRLLPLVFYGETARKGNRFFDFKELASGKLLFKLESTTVRIPISFNTKKHKKEIDALQELAKDKGIAVTVKLSGQRLMLTFDESILHGTSIDIKAFYKTISHVKDKNERKVLIAAKHKEHEKFLCSGKIAGRHMGLDLNPDGIGWCIMDRNGLRLIDRGFLDISSVTKASKRKYETSILIKELFKKISHHRCSKIVLEELSFKEKDLGNKVSNRKVNNLWNRELISNIIKRRCNETGVQQVDVNPAYSSFIGNVLHDQYDPIAASFEICRRGIFKYSKGGFYPEFGITSVPSQLHGKTEGCKTWKDLHSLFVTSKLSYRRELKQFSFAAHHLMSSNSGCLRLLFA
jgi:IS605 OrfB family transposase